MTATVFLVGVGIVLVLLFTALLGALIDIRRPVPLPRHSKGRLSSLDDAAPVELLMDQVLRDAQVRQIVRRAGWPSVGRGGPPGETPALRALEDTPRGTSVDA